MNKPVAATTTLPSSSTSIAVDCSISDTTSFLSIVEFPCAIPVKLAVFWNNF